MIQFDEHIFLMGWFNHQLEKGWFDLGSSQKKRGAGHSKNVAVGFLIF